MRSLYNFLGLEGFDEAAVGGVLADSTQGVRHFHTRHAQTPASKEELSAAWTICAPLAAQHGYAEEAAFYSDAPSRPPQEPANATTPTVQDAANSGPVSVKLLDHRGLGLIIKCPSGLEYVSQCGGPICFWFRVEGAFVPLTDGGIGTPVQRLFEHFHLGRDKTFMRSVESADGDFIDSLLTDSGLEFIKVNRSRIGNARDFDASAWEAWDGQELRATPWEAWVPVTVRHAPYDRLHGVLSECASHEAILVWENSN